MYNSMVNLAQWADVLQAEPQIQIDLDTTSLFQGANLMTAALSSPFLFIAGLGLGVAILGAIIRAVQSVRL